MLKPRERLMPRELPKSEHRSVNGLTCQQVCSIHMLRQITHVSLVATNKKKKLFHVIVNS